MNINKKMVTDKLNHVKTKACEMAKDFVVIGKNVMKDFKDRAKKTPDVKPEAKPDEKK